MEKNRSFADINPSSTRMGFFFARCGFFWFALGLSTAVSAESSVDPAYMEEARGQTHLWLSTGPTYWFSDRVDHPQWTPITAAVGLSHTIDPVRLAWNFRWTHDSERSTNFVSVDLISVEKLYSVGRLRPYLRGGLAVGLDLSHADRSFGGSGFFNEDLGNTGGLGLTLGTGLDMTLGQDWILHTDLGMSTFGGVGLTTLSGQLNLGIGYGF